MSRRLTTLLASAALVAGLGFGQPVFAQTPGADSGAAPALELSVEQKHTIYQSVSATEKNSAAPPGFRPTVGAHVPEMIALKSMPETLAKLIPAAKALEVGMVEKQVILVEPTSKVVVAVVTHAE
jgi:hypothetical protein